MVLSDLYGNPALCSNHLITLYLHSMISFHNELYPWFYSSIIGIYFSLDNSLPLTIYDAHTHCFKCCSHLRGGRVWCYRCGTYMHIKCSGLSTKSAHYSNFIFKHYSERTRSDPEQRAIDIQTTSNEACWECCDGPQTECAMICTIIMPPLILVRSKSDTTLQ